MKQNAVVTKTFPDGFAEIMVTRKSACSADCESCHGCAHPEEKVYIKAKNIAQAEVGEQVVVESSTSAILGWASLIYLFPVFLMFLVYFVIDSLEIIRISASIVGLMVGFIICRLISDRVLKNKSIKFNITEIMR